MSGQIHGQTMPDFTVNEALSKSVTAGEQLNANTYSAIAFDADVSLTIGALSTGFQLKAFQPMRLDSSTQDFSADTSCFMFAMGK